MADSVEPAAEVIYVNPAGQEVTVGERSRAALTVVVVGPQGAPGVSQIQGDDGDDAWVLPGPQGLIGVQGPPGQSSVPGSPGDDGDDAWVLPGPPGPTGVGGSVGPPGPNIPGSTGDDGDDAWVLPGPPGPTGLQGSTGQAGATVPGATGDDGDDAWVLPGPQGIIGIQGPTGQSNVPGPAGDDGDDGWSVPTVIPSTFTQGFKFVAFNAGTISSGTFTPDAANGNYQFYINGGAHTLAAPALDSALDILITNNASASTITFSGFTVNSNTGEALTTINTNKFLVSIRRINSVATYIIKALQ